MYIYLENNTVREIIPDIDPVFPGVPISQRYAPDFVKKLMHFPDDTEVHQNWVYDPDTKNFSEPPPPPEPDPVEEPEYVPSIEERKVAALEFLALNSLPDVT